MNTYRWLLKLIFFVGVASSAGLAQALSWHRDGEDLYVSGMIQSGDDLMVQAAYQEAPFTRLVLVDSPGGSFLVGLRIARWVEERRLATVVAGHCLSACSLIFVAGEQRQFAQARPGQTHWIGIHGPYARSTGEPSSAGAQMMLSYLRHRMGDKYDPALMERAVYQMHDPSGLLGLPQAGSAGGLASAWHCPSSRSRRDLCTRFPDKNALNLGLLTSDLASEVRIPAQWAERSRSALDALTALSALTVWSAPVAQSHPGP